MFGRSVSDQISAELAKTEMFVNCFRKKPNNMLNNYRSVSFASSKTNWNIASYTESSVCVDGG